MKLLIKILLIVAGASAVLGLLNVIKIELNTDKINEAINNISNNQQQDQQQITNLSDLNIHFSESSPEDTSMLWVKTANAPTKLSYSNKADVELLSEFQGCEYIVGNYRTNAFVNGVYYDFYNQKKFNVKTGEVVEASTLTSPGDNDIFTTYFNNKLYFGRYKVISELDLSTDTITSLGNLNNDSNYAYSPLVLNDSNYLYMFGKTGARKYLLSDINSNIYTNPLNYNTIGENSDFYGSGDKKAYIIDNFIITIAGTNGSIYQTLYLLNKDTLEIQRENLITDTYSIIIQDSFVLYNELYVVLTNGDLMKYDLINDKFINLNKNIGSFIDSYCWNDLASNDVYIYRDGKFSVLDNKMMLNTNECLLYYSEENEEKFKLYKNDNINAQVCLPEAVYIGNENGEAVKYEAYIFDKQTLQWELI